jgi:hypothetical protein
LFDPALQEFWVGPPLICSLFFHIQKEEEKTVNKKKEKVKAPCPLVEGKSLLVTTCVITKRVLCSRLSESMGQNPVLTP